MNMNELYNTAKKYADKLREEKPGYVSGEDSALCLIVTDKNEIFSGVTSVRISGGKTEEVHAEFNAVMSMKEAGQTAAKQMITVLFKDQSICVPCSDCLDLLFRASESNNNCAVMTGPDKASSAMSLRFGTSEDQADFLSGFDFDDGPSESALGAPAEYAQAIAVDESNPFNATSDEAQTEVVTFTGDRKKEDSPAPEAAADTADSAAEAQGGGESAPAPESKPEAAAPAAENAADKEDAPSMEDMLKQAKKRKKIAKANFNFFRR